MGTPVSGMMKMMKNNIYSGMSNSAIAGLSGYLVVLGTGPKFPR
jgi:hypothetical protein